MKSKSRTVFICQNCGRESPKWLGRCPDCQEWNSLVESVVHIGGSSASWLPSADNEPQELSQVQPSASARLEVPSAEFNRVLGGGLVKGSLILLGGDPGIGKSTLLLQLSATIAEKGSRVLYISGEESLQQIRLRAERLKIGGQKLFLLSETNVDVILGRLEELSPNMAVIDSVQTVYLENQPGAPGSIGQIRESTLKLMRWAKKSEVPVLLSGHVTKDGTIAGPRVLEHIVDMVMYLEGEPFSAYRLLRSVKNRFGSTNEVGIYEMSGSGLVEVDNPSLAFLSHHRETNIGSVVVPTLEGSRPLLVEIQALSSLAAFGPPRRLANGIDFGRLLVIAAVLTKRAGLKLSNQDIMVNVTGGLKVNEPAADLGVALAIASSFQDRSIRGNTVALGELGLSGELRAVPQIERRVAEAERLGFQRCIIPRLPQHDKISSGLELVQATTVAEALRLGLQQKTKEVDIV